MSDMELEDGEVEEEEEEECFDLGWDEVGMDVNLDEVLGKLGAVMDEVELHMKEEEESTTHPHEKGTGNEKTSSSEGRHKRNSVSTAKDGSPSGNRRSSSSLPRNTASIDSSSQNTNNHRKRKRKSRWSNKVEQDEECNRELSVRCTGPSVINISSQIITAFFSEVGIVCTVRKSYGNVYVEFANEESVEKALTLSGKMIAGTPITVEAMDHTSVHPTADDTQLYLHNLNPEKVTEDYLRGIFMKYGNIKLIKIVRDGDTGQSFGFGFIKFSTKEAAKSAWRKEEGTMLEGQCLRVEWLYDVQKKVKPVSVKHDAQLESLEKLIAEKERSLSRSSQEESSAMKGKLQPNIQSLKKATDKKIEINFLNKSQARIRSLLSKVNNSDFRKIQKTKATAASTTFTTTTTTTTPSIMPKTMVKYPYLTSTTPGVRSHFPAYLPKAMARHFPPRSPAAVVAHFPPPPPSSVIDAVHSMPYPSATVPSFNPQPMSSAGLPNTGMVISSHVATKRIMETASPETEKKTTENQQKVAIQKKAYEPSHKRQLLKTRELKSERQPNLTEISWVMLYIDGLPLDNKQLLSSVPMIAQAKREKKSVDLYISTIGKKRKRLCDFVIPLTGGLKWKMIKRKWHVQLVEGATDSAEEVTDCQRVEGATDSAEEVTDCQSDSRHADFRFQPHEIPRSILKFSLLPGIVSQAWFVIDGNTTELLDINHAMGKIIKACEERKSVKVEVTIAENGNFQIDSVLVALTVQSTWKFSMEKLRWQSCVLAEPLQLERISAVMPYMPVQEAQMPIAANHSCASSLYKMLQLCSNNPFKDRIILYRKLQKENLVMEGQPLLYVTTDEKGSQFEKFLLPLSSSCLGVWTLTSNSDSREWVALLRLSEGMCLRATAIPRSLPMDDGEILVAQPNLKSLESATIMYGEFAENGYDISDIKKTITLLLEDDRQRKDVFLRVLPTVDNCKPELTDVVVPITVNKYWTFNTSVLMWETRIHTENALKILLAETDKPQLEVNEVAPESQVEKRTQGCRKDSESPLPNTPVVTVDYNHGLPRDERSERNTPHQTKPITQRDPRRMSFKEFTELCAETVTLEEAMKEYALYSVRIYFQT